MSFPTADHFFNRINIINPKRDISAKTGNASWYPYYAGFSPDFALSLCQSINFPKNSTVLDPWNGSGTTTDVASSLGLNSIGIDLNPVMVIAAKARSLSLRTKHSLKSLAKNIIDNADKYDVEILEDPLADWIVPSSIHHLRQIELSIQNLLIDGECLVNLTDREQVNSLSDLAAFFYIGLFRTLRRLVFKFMGTNPTWVKRPKNLKFRIRPTREHIFQIFSNTILDMIESIRDVETVGFKNESNISIQVASSTNLPLKDNSIDFVLSSPPYCTRIDYAVASSPELALLGFIHNKSFKNLRTSLLGTPLTFEHSIIPNESWGKTCLNFLHRMKNHQSKSSANYYYKTHIQYFSGIADSILELKRVLKEKASCVIVAQDSYYKDIHNNVPEIIAEMMFIQGFKVIRKEIFHIKKSMASINPKIKKYRTRLVSKECVLCLER